MSDLANVDPAVLMQQLRERDAAAVAAATVDPLAVVRQMLAAYAFPATDRAALDAVVVEVERLRAERDEARQLLRDCWIAAGLLNENWTGVPDLIAEIEDLVTCAKYLDEAEDELVRTRKLAAGLAERVAAQSELLARAAAKVPAEPIPTLWGAVS